MNRRILLVAVALLAVCASLSDGAIRIVRTGTTYSTVAAAASASEDGDTIEIDSGTYSGTTACATFYRNNLTLRGVGTTRPILDAGGTSAQGKGIWVIAGSGATVEFLEFQNCHVVDKNGAGIRQEGANLTVRNCYFHDNENGILSGANTSSTILIETSEFNHNGYGDGYSHQIYIGNVGQLTVRYCYFHHGWKGQEIKTRANVNYILYNRITCEDGYSNYEVSACQGGTTYVIGNLIHQGPNTTNSTIVDYASEGMLNPDSHLYVVNNTIVNTRGAGTFVRNMGTVDALLQNNIFQGVGTVLSGPGTQVTNWVTSNAYLASPSTYDFHLTASSTGAIDVGTTPGTGINGFNMNPTLQYVHPRSSETRPVVGTIDIGCYEYGTAGNQAPSVEAGNNQSITWPNNVVNLDGTVTDDGLPNPPAAVTTIWSMVSGPGTVTFGNVYAVDTTATFSQAGTYVLQLLADDSALQATDTVTITVNGTAAPTFVAAGAVASGTGAITAALPSGLQANDILLLFVETANQAISITNHNGGTWTEVTGSPQGTGTAGGTAATCLTAFWSRYNGTQGSPSLSDSGNHQIARMIAIRGATTSGNPWDVTAGGVEATSDTSGSIPGATTTVANTLVVAAIATALPDANSTAKFSGWSNADLSSLTERTDNTSNVGNGGGLAIATGGKAAAGAYGATAVTLVNAAQKGMMSIAIKP
jgi:hypothetical protein